MSEVDSYRERVSVAREALEAVPVLGPGVPGPPDESTGERWDRTHVLGHLAEMLPFWTGQVREVLAGGDELGRGEPGYARRREGIDAGPQLGEEELRRRIGAGVQGLMALLDDLRGGARLVIVDSISESPARVTGTPDGVNATIALHVLSGLPAPAAAAQAVMASPPPTAAPTGVISGPVTRARNAAGAANARTAAQGGG